MWACGGMAPLIRNRGTEWKLVYSPRNSLRYPLESDDKWALEPTWMLWMKCDIFWEEIFARFLWYDTNRIENEVTNLCIGCSRNLFSEPLPGNDEEISGVRRIHRFIDRKLMSYATLYFLKYKEAMLKNVSHLWEIEPLFLYSPGRSVVTVPNEPTQLIRIINWET
jgi:hypothetical protein